MPKRAEPSLPTLPLEQPERFDRTAPAAAPVGTPATPVAAPVEVVEDAVARFEQEMQELESIVAQMEKGDLRLEDSLRLFERGSQLTRSCRRSLDTAELKVRNLLDEDEAAPGA